jgi:glycosyltransferase involved in cell wall biosynthesis
MTTLTRSQTPAPIGVTTLPIVGDIMDGLPVQKWVYYCVDDFTSWPGLDSDAMTILEQKVIARADVVIAASETLAERLTSMGKTPTLLTHGVDFNLWRLSTDLPGLPSIEDLERPLVIFWGLVDQRIDVSFLRRTADEMSRGTLLLVGPEQQADPELKRLPRVAYRPAIRYKDLPLLAREAAVLIMPYADSPATRAMQPLKLKEYLATGKPVVVRALPAVKEWSDSVDVAATADDFAAAVKLRLTEGLPETQARARSRLSEESWEAKARRFEELICTNEFAAI